MIFYFVRHGQTDFNKAHRLQGAGFDEPLNEQGIKDMQEVLPKLPKDFEVIFSSSLKRVSASAEIISKYSSKEIIIRDEVREREVGSLAGKTWDDIPNGQDVRLDDRALKFDYRKYGGESVENVKKRATHFINEVKKMGYKKALVVSSLGFLRVMYLVYKNELVTKIDNGTIHTFEI